jgi:hypothetical protein
MLDLHAFLKIRKAGDAVLERDDPAISDKALGLLLMKRRRYLWISLVQQYSVSREEGQFAAAAKC